MRLESWPADATFRSRLRRWTRRCAGQVALKIRSFHRNGKEIRAFGLMLECVAIGATALASTHRSSHGSHHATHHSGRRSTPRRWRLVRPWTLVLRKVRPSRDCDRPTPECSRLSSPACWGGGGLIGRWRGRKLASSGMCLVSHDPRAPVKARSRRKTPTPPLGSQGEETSRYDGFAGSKSLMPSTVSVTDAGGSPSARSHPLPTARRIAASMASLFAVPRLC